MKDWRQNPKSEWRSPKAVRRPNVESRFTLEQKDGLDLPDPAKRRTLF